jgi:hypothetical protein
LGGLALNHLAAAGRAEPGLPATAHCKAEPDETPQAAAQERYQEVEDVIHARPPREDIALARRTKGLRLLITHRSKEALLLAQSKVAVA